MEKNTVMEKNTITQIVYAIFKVEAKTQAEANKIIAHELHWIQDKHVTLAEVNDVIPELVFSREDMKDFLTEQLEKIPTEDQIDEFINYMSADTYEWQKNNFNCWQK